MTAKKKPSKKKQVKSADKLIAKSILAFAAETGKIYLTKLGIQVLIKRVATNGVQVIPEFASKTLTIKRHSLLFPCPKKRIGKKQAAHFKACSEKWNEEALNRTTVKTEPTAILAVQPTILSEPVLPPSPTQVRRGPKGPRGMSVTSIVDPMLFSGRHTRQEMINALAQSEVGLKLANKDFGWYVAYRISVLKEKGYTLEQLEGGIITVSRQILKSIENLPARVL